MLSKSLSVPSGSNFKSRWRANEKIIGGFFRQVMNSRASAGFFMSDDAVSSSL
jgi:hypothetical protein